MKKINYIFSFFLILTFNFSTTAQVTTFSKSIKIEESNDYSREIIEFNGHYYLTSNSLCFNDGINTCFHLTKTDLEGNIIWNKKFENLETKLDNPGGFITNILPNNTLLLTASTYNEDYSIANPFLINVNTDGDTLWTKRIESDLWEVIWAAKMLPSGNFITFGNETSSEGIVHLSVRHLTPEGETIFKTEVTTDCNRALFNNAEWTDDGHLLIGHHCATDPFGKYPMVTKIDTLGNEIWTEYWEDWAQYIIGVRLGMIQPLPDGGYAFPWKAPGINNIFTSSILAYDSTHQQMWSTPLPTRENGFVPSEIYYLNKTVNGDFIWVGALTGVVPDDFYIACIGRINPEGEHKWTRYYHYPDISGTPDLTYITETSDGGLLAVGGRSDESENYPGETIPNTWILKVDADGCMTPDCTDEVIYFQNDSVIVNTKAPLFQQATYFHLSPNPADDKTQLNFIASATNRQTIKIFSIDGQLMQQIEINGSDQTIEVDLVDFSAGIYVVALEEEGQVLQRERLIKR